MPGGSEVGRNRDAWKARLILVQYLEDEDFEQKQPSDPLPTKQQVREYLEVMLQGVRMRQDVFEFTKPEDQVEAWEDAESIGHVIDLLDAALGDLRGLVLRGFFVGGAAELEELGPDHDRCPPCTTRAGAQYGPA